MTNRIDKWADRRILAKPTVFKKYPTRVVFLATTFQKKLNKEKELKLKQIIKEMDQLYKKLGELWRE